MPFNDPNASYKALFYFKDKNKFTAYSRDFANGDTKKRIPKLGHARLLRLVVKWAKKTDTAIIIDRNIDEPCNQYFEGIEVPITWNKD
jgi:hypothetical protein